MPQQQPKQTPKFVGSKEGAKSVSAALANSQKIVDQAKK
jgi:hypothetical protein